MYLLITLYINYYLMPLNVGVASFTRSLSLLVVNNRKFGEASVLMEVGSLFRRGSVLQETHQQRRRPELQTNLRRLKALLSW